MQSGMFDTTDSGMSHFSSQVWGYFQFIVTAGTSESTPVMLYLDKFAFTESPAPSHESTV
jgi:hypothetical protein